MMKLFKNINYIINILSFQHIVNRNINIINILLKNINTIQILPQMMLIFFIRLPSKSLIVIEFSQITPYELGLFSLGIETEPGFIT